MSHLIFGIVVLVAPLFSVFFYPTIREGLTKTLLYIVAFHVTLSIVSQAFHVFSYGVVATANVLFSVFLIVSTFYLAKRKGMDQSIPVFLKKVGHVFKNNWIIIAALLVIFFQLYSVHQSYSGIVQTINGQQTVTTSSYPYPLFSDEWITVSLADYSITSHKLPLVNPLDRNIPFSNILFSFSAVLAELFLMTGLSALTSYWVFAVFFGLTICFSLHALLRVYGVNKYTASAFVLLLPYIANSANLPGLWFLLPYTLSTIVFIWQLISQKCGYSLHASFFAITALLIYPPLVVFVAPALLVAFIRRQKAEKSQKSFGSVLRYASPLIICLVVFGIIFYFVFAHFGTSISDILRMYIIRPNLDPEIISYAIWNVLPILGLLLSPIGIYVAIKRRHVDILTVLCIGLVYWCLYIFINKVVIIEYPRIVTITSFFLIVSAAIGVDHIFAIWIEKLKLGSEKNSKDALRSARFIPVIVASAAVVVSVVLLPSYTSGTSWMKFTMTLRNAKGDTREVRPAAPVNRYLTPDDLRLFKDIRSEKFIAPAWKGLVIGVATHNFPLETKSSTVTNRIYPYTTFMSLSCSNKTKIAAALQVGHVYSSAFSCPGFDEVGTSSEGLHLYHYK